MQSCATASSGAIVCNAGEHCLKQVPRRGVHGVAYWRKEKPRRKVREGGLEPPRVTPPEPKSGASANSATPAFVVAGPRLMATHHSSDGLRSMSIERRRSQRGGRDSKIRLDQDARGQGFKDSIGPGCEGPSVARANSPWAAECRPGIVRLMRYRPLIVHRPLTGGSGPAPHRPLTSGSGRAPHRP